MGCSDRRRPIRSSSSRCVRSSITSGTTDRAARAHRLTRRSVVARCQPGPPRRRVPSPDRSRRRWPPRAPRRPGEQAVSGRRLEDDRGRGALPIRGHQFDRSRRRGRLGDDGLCGGVERLGDHHDRERVEVAKGELKVVVIERGRTDRSKRRSGRPAVLVERRRRVPGLANDQGLDGDREILGSGVVSVAVGRIERAASACARSRRVATRPTPARATARRVASPARSSPTARRLDGATGRGGHRRDARGEAAGLEVHRPSRARTAASR